MKKRDKFEVVGYITVDAGIVEIGDPCYRNHDSFENHDNWINYLDDSGISKGADVVAVPHPSDAGNYSDAAKAIVIRSGFGDGVYAVEVKKDSETGLPKELRIKFF